MLKQPKVPRSYYDIQEWEQCFADYKALEELGIYHNLRLVLSTHTYSEGYWIENSAVQLPKHDFGYRGKAVWELYDRVKAAIDKAKAKGEGWQHFGLIT